MPEAASTRSRVLRSKAARRGLRLDGRRAGAARRAPEGRAAPAPAVPGRRAVARSDGRGLDDAAAPRRAAAPRLDGPPETAGVLTPADQRQSPVYLRWYFASSSVAISSRAVARIASSPTSSYTFRRHSRMSYRTSVPFFSVAALR